MTYIDEECECWLCCVRRRISFVWWYQSKYRLAELWCACGWWLLVAWAFPYKITVEDDMMQGGTTRTMTRSGFGRTFVWRIWWAPQFHPNCRSILLPMLGKDKTT